MAKQSSHVAKPVYPGGLTALKKFVADNLRYPPQALTAKVEGTVTVRYGLDYRGKVVEAKVKKGLGHGCDEEALRVVRLLRYDVPQHRKKKVRIHQDLNIHFKLPAAPKEKTAPKPAAISVTYTAGKTKASATAPEKQPGAGNGYGYTIKW